MDLLDYHLLIYDDPFEYKWDNIVLDLKTCEFLNSFEEKYIDYCEDNQSDYILVNRLFNFKNSFYDKLCLKPSFLNVKNGTCTKKFVSFFPTGANIFWICGHSPCLIALEMAQQRSDVTIDCIDILDKKVKCMGLESTHLQQHNYFRNEINNVRCNSILI